MMSETKGETPPTKGEGSSVDKWSQDWWWGQISLWGSRLFYLSIIFGTIAGAAAWGVSCYVQPDVEALGDQIDEAKGVLRDEFSAEIDGVEKSLTSSIETTRSDLHGQINGVSNEISEIRGILEVIRDLVTPGRTPGRLPLDGLDDLDAEKLEGISENER